VRVLGGESGTATKVRVLLESADATRPVGHGGRVRRTSSMASYQALVDAIRYKLLKDKKAAESAKPKSETGAAHPRRKRLASAS